MVNVLIEWYKEDNILTFRIYKMATNNQPNKKKNSKFLYCACLTQKRIRSISEKSANKYKTKVKMTH